MLLRAASAHTAAAQVGYSTVFVLEYLGPILVYALIYFCPGLAYSHLQHAHRSGLEKLVPYQECVLRTCAG